MIIPCSVSISFSIVQWSSSPSNPASSRILNCVAVFIVGAHAIIVSACSFVGVIGILLLILKTGLFQCRLLVFTKLLYIAVRMCFVVSSTGCSFPSLFIIVIFAMCSLTVSGSIRSTNRFICLRADVAPLIVAFFLPFFAMFCSVFIILALYSVYAGSVSKFTWYPAIVVAVGFSVIFSLSLAGVTVFLRVF